MPDLNSKPVAVTLRLSADERQRLRVAAAQRGTSMGGLVREITLLYLERPFLTPVGPPKANGDGKP
jgi:hypothetical protein